MDMNSTLFIVMVWAFLPDGDHMFLGEHPVLASNQTEALKPAIDELVAEYNMEFAPEGMMPEGTSFFATIKTNYRGRYYASSDND